MARQDQANDQFSLTSFLYGGNAEYIEQLHASYEDDPASVAQEVEQAYRRLGMQPARATSRSGWVALVLRASW